MARAIKTDLSLSLLVVVLPPSSWESLEIVFICHRPGVQSKQKAGSEGRGGIAGNLETRSKPFLIGESVGEERKRQQTQSGTHANTQPALPLFEGCKCSPLSVLERMERVEERRGVEVLSTLRKNEDEPR